MASFHILREGWLKLACYRDATTKRCTYQNVPKCESELSHGTHVEVCICVAVATHTVVYPILFQLDAAETHKLDVSNSSSSGDHELDDV